MISLLPAPGGKILPEVNVAFLRNSFSQRSPLMTADFEIVGEEPSPIEHGGSLLGYLYDAQNAPIVSIDHHGDDPRMWRRVSSTNLMATEIRRAGVPGHCIISHCDFDSIASAGLASGRLPMSMADLLGEAAIAADHTGEENILADTIQPLREMCDVEYSLSCLDILLSQGEHHLPILARAALDGRRAERERLKALVAEGIFQRRENKIYAGYLDTRINAELLPALLPDAIIIVTVSPPRVQGDGHEIKTRLGLAAPDGMSLRDLHLPGWGGRWNAGSTGRRGGTRDPEAFMRLLISM